MTMEDHRNGTVYQPPTSTTTAPPEPPCERNSFDLTRQDRVFVLLLTALCVAVSAFGLWGGLHTGWTVSFLAVFAVATAYLCGKGRRVTAFSVGCAALCVTVSLLFAETTNGVIRFLGFVTQLILMLVWFGTTVTDRADRTDLGLVNTVFAPVFRLGFRYLPTTVRSLFVGNRQGRIFGKILLGVLVSLPALGIVVPLLQESDEAFSGLMTMLATHLGETVGKVFVGLLLALFVVGYCVAVRKESLPDRPVRTFGGIDSVVLGTFLSALSVCYLAYLFSQLAYFFSGFGGFLPEGYTFTVAEYARRGFFEMSALAAINFGFVFLALLLARKQEGTPRGAVRWLCVFIIVFTLLILATAVSKMVLYMRSFGLTVLRVGTTAFMLCLAVVFLCLLCRLFVKKASVLKTAVLTVGVVLTVLGVGNVNRLVAAYNYHAYHAGWLESVDVQQLYDLGSEGVPYLVELTHDADDEIVDKATTCLRQCLQSGIYYECEYDDSDYAGSFTVTKPVSNDWSQSTAAHRRAAASLATYLENKPEERQQALVDTP